MPSHVELGGVFLCKDRGVAQSSTGSRSLLLSNTLVLEAPNVLKRSTYIYVNPVSFCRALFFLSIAQTEGEVVSCRPCGVVNPKTY